MALMQAAPQPTETAPFQTLPELLALLTQRPADVFGLAAGRLVQGSAADLCVFDPDQEVQFAPGAFYSKSQNSPFVDRPWHGVVHQTLVDGHIVFDRRLLSSG